MTTEPRPRAVFSPDDFRLMREALAHHLKTAPDGPDGIKLANLFHRLSRVG